jgi:Tol biopolymer transport system component
MRRSMSLAPGTRIGPYQVVGPLGAGGMGEVYRARDTTLGRDVALKVLPERFAGDRARFERLEREARIVASLNHANIAAIHGVVDSGTGSALVLELVDGPTLAERLDAGRLSLEDTLRIARQIAEALESAHEQGVVHRDLKPANVKVRPDGTVKVLDFGIAKVLEAPGTPSETAATVSLTAAGVAIGTPAYMSPEQARGSEVTPRSDVWAFGAVLYEMLTGRRPFIGATASDVLAAVLQTTPDWTALPAATPPAIARLVRRCLEREPKARLHDIGDARLEIEDAQRALRGDDPFEARARPEPVRAGMRRRSLGWAALAAVLTLGLAAYLTPRRSTDTAPPEVRLQLAPPPGTRFVSVPAVSPDGREIAFVAGSEGGGEGRLWRRPLGAAAATEVPGTSGAAYPFWSADGRAVAFFAAGQLKRVAIAGGNPVVVCDAPAGRGGLWLDDDTIIFTPTATSPLRRVSATGGSPVPLTALTEAETSHRFPQRLPGGQLLYFSVNRAPEKSGTRLVAIDDPNREVAFIPTRGAAEYVKGFLLFTPLSPGGSTPVLAQRLMLPSGQLSGEPMEIGETRISETLGRYVVATAPSGVVAMQGPVDGIGQFAWVARDGRVLETIGPPTIQLGVELSPDRQQLATYRSGEIWTMDLARPVPIRVTRGGPHRHPIWSPDGARLLTLLQGRGIGTFDLVTTAIATGEVATVLQGVNMQKPMGWTRDGRLVWIASEATGSGATSISTLPPGGEPALVLQEKTQTYEARVSPDGQWIAYASNRSGRFEIEVSRFPEGGARYPVSMDGGGYPRWRADGRELYFLSADGRLMATTFSAGPRPTLGRPAPLFEVRLIAHPDRGIFAGYEYDVAADGSRFLLNRMVSPPAASMTVIVGWNPLS